MYFCPNCSYVFNIAKSNAAQNNDTRVILDKSVDVFKIFETDNDLTKYKASFPADEITKNKKYLKLSSEDNTSSTFKRVLK